jgi:hypothetical protein
VVVETAKQALAKVDELIELAHVEDVSVRDWSGKIMDLGALEAEAAEAWARRAGGDGQERAGWPSGSRRPDTATAIWRVLIGAVPQARVRNRRGLSRTQAARKPGNESFDSAASDEHLLAMALERATLLAHLAQAERYVVQGEAHIGRQEALIVELERDGHDTKDALPFSPPFERLKLSIF